MKQDFFQAVNAKDNLSLISVAVKLPTGAIEVITNTQELESKALYYIENYDYDFRLNHNKDVQIVGFMVV